MQVPPPPPPPASLPPAPAAVIAASPTSRCRPRPPPTAHCNSTTCAQDFFKTKFPELSKNRFSITGESYAGVYVPTLSREILDNAPEINLVSIAVGDPCTDNDAQKQSMDMLWCTPHRWARHCCSLPSVAFPPANSLMPGRLMPS